MCSGLGMVVGQWQVWGALQVSLRLAPADFPVPPHPYDLEHSGLLGATLENSQIGCLPYPLMLWSQALCMCPFSPMCSQEFLLQCWQLRLGAEPACIPLWPLHTPGCYGEFPCWRPPISQVAGIRHLECTCSLWPLHALGCSRELLCQCLWSTTGGQGSAPCTHSPTVFLYVTSVAPAHIFVHPFCGQGNFLVLLRGGWDSGCQGDVTG